MKKCIIMSLGYDTSALMSTLAEYRVESDDKFVFVIPSTSSSRQQVTIGEIEKTLRVLESKGLRLEFQFLEIDEHHLEEAVLSIASKIVENLTREIYVEASGGLRGICIALYIAAAYFSELVIGFHTIAETTGKRVNVPISTLSTDLKGVYRTLITLVVDSRENCTVEYLVTQTSKDRTTLCRQLEKLLRLNLLSRKRIEKRWVYVATLSGKLVAMKLASLRNIRAK